MNDYTKNFSEQTAQKITFLYANLQYTVVYGHMAHATGKITKKISQKATSIISSNIFFPQATWLFKNICMCRLPEWLKPYFVQATQMFKKAGYPNV